jgi:hypothetical protein
MQDFKKMMEDLAELKPTWCLLPYLKYLTAYLFRSASIVEVALEFSSKSSVLIELKEIHILLSFN